MLSSTYHNSKTGSGATFHVCASRESREITVEVGVSDSAKHTYKKHTFTADKYGEAIDFYDKIVKEMEGK